MTKSRRNKIIWCGVAIMSITGISFASTTISTDIFTTGSLTAATSTLATTTVSNLTVLGTCSNCGGNTPGGASSTLQFNQNGIFGGSPNLTFDSSTLTVPNLTATGNVNITGTIMANIIPLQDTAANLSGIVATSGQIVYETDTKYSLVGDGSTMIGNLSPLGDYGTSSPWGLISINSSGTSGRPAFVVASSSNVNLIVSNNGFVGIGTSSPFAGLSVASPTGVASTTFAVIGSSTLVGGGQNISFLTGSTLTNSSNLNGGSFLVTTGNASYGGSSSGNGGDILFTTGNGLTRGGNISFTLGSNSGAAPANGGSFSVASGNGGNKTGGLAGTGGSVSLTAGNGGSSVFSGTSGSGGNVTISAGAGGTGTSGGTNAGGGNVIIMPGATGGSPALGGNVGIGTTTPIANLQVTNISSNATTTIEFGVSGQSKGTCVTYHDAAGSPVYMYFNAGASTPTYQNGGSAPAGCVN